jgi:hypothetical protein
MAVGAPLRGSDHPRTIEAGDKITNAVHPLGIPGDGDWAKVNGYDDVETGRGA